MCFDTFRLPPLRERETQEEGRTQDQQNPTVLFDLKTNSVPTEPADLLRTKFLWIDENRNPATEYPVKMQMRYAKSIHSA